MKSSKRLLATSIAAACAAAPMSVFATNGDALIGLGAQSRALGGTGTAAFFGSENALSNPALLGKSKGTEFAFGGTLFMPDVKSETNVSGAAASQTSKADTNIIPEVSMSTRINDNLTFGIGMYGTAGMGVDYRDTAGLFNATSSLQLMKFAPTLAYNKGSFGVGIAPVIQYGALDINYVNSSGTQGAGVASDLGTGYNLGLYYDVNDSLTVALAYQSSIDMKYKGQIVNAADGFGIGTCGACMGTITTDNMEQPAELKVGVAYTMSSWMVTADYKQIQWGSAKGYKAFNWKDQDVYAVGAKYSGEGYWLGAGYNHGKDPIKVLPSSQDAAGYSNQAVNMFNNHFFPGIVEDHFTFGGGIALNKNMTLEGAVVYAGQVSKTINTGTISSYMGGAGFTGMPVDATTQKTTHSQVGYTISLRMNF